MRFNKSILDKSKLYLSALSGGADSTALLLMLIDGGYNVEAVHCNFHLRGAESDRDETFCRRLCEEKGVKIHVVYFDTTAYAEGHHQSIETAARNLRYHYFFSLARDIDAAGICVAHNMNDQAETMLMKLVRGAGIHGLSGMKTITNVDFNGNRMVILRPMLDIKRSEIVDYLHLKNQSWVTDSTNLETEATRNKFRLEIIPMIEKINPSAIENIAGACERLARSAEIYDDAIDKAISRVSADDNDMILIDIDKLLHEKSPESVLFEIMNRNGFSGSQTVDVFRHLDGNSGRVWKNAHRQLVVDRSQLIISDVDEGEAIDMTIPEEGNYIVNDNLKIKIKRQEWKQGDSVPHDKSIACLDASKVVFPLHLRQWKQGDRFTPFGMRGSKLISDFLTDLKLSVVDKQRQLVLCSADDKIIWVVGLRPDNRFRITQSTTEVLFISTKS